MGDDGSRNDGEMMVTAGTWNDQPWLYTECRAPDCRWWLGWSDEIPLSRLVDADEAHGREHAGPEQATPDHGQLTGTWLDDLTAHLGAPDTTDTGIGHEGWDPAGRWTWTRPRAEVALHYTEAQAWRVTVRGPKAELGVRLPGDSTDDQMRLMCQLAGLLPARHHTKE